MALVTCRECGAQVSDEAKACPQCGAKPKKKRGCLGVVGLGVGAIVVIATIGAMNQKPPPEKTPEQKAAAAKDSSQAAAVAAAAQAVKKAMKNPDAFKLTSAGYTDGGAVCLEYRSTNSFNAVVPGFAVIAGGKATSDDPAAWNKHCANKPISDYRDFATRMLDR